jgi:spore coat protein U-like protein
MKLDTRIVLGVLVFISVCTSSTTGIAGAAQCTLSATPLAFGKYVPSSTKPSDFSATLQITCTAVGIAPTPVHGTIRLAGRQAGPWGRKLNNGSSALIYQLYLDPARTGPWGNNVSNAISFSGIVSPNSVFRESFTVYGRLLARQWSVRVGNYSDQVMVILDYQ